MLFLTKPVEPDLRGHHEYPGVSPADPHLFQAFYVKERHITGIVDKLVRWPAGRRDCCDSAFGKGRRLVRGSDPRRGQLGPIKQYRHLCLGQPRVCPVLARLHSPKRLQLLLLGPVRFGSVCSRSAAMAPVLRLLLVAAALLPTATSASLNETTYVVTVSSVLTGGKQETLCAQIQNPTARLSLTISLALDTTSSIILQQSITQNFYTCVRFKVPLVLVNTVATIQVSLQDEATSVNKTTKVMIEPPDIIHLIQTDKPIYKPGQTVQFRIVSMDVNFLPVDQVYTEVTLQDPNTNRIAQWLNKTIVGVGILDFSFLIIPEAAQGTYTITAVTDKGEEINNNFDIKEYVLPKYEVNIFLPSVITILDKEATVKICGKYTYGKPVQGRAKVEFCRKATWFFWFTERRAEDICRSFELTTDKTGCASVKVKLSEFALNQYSYADSFDVTAELEEFGTGVTLKSSGSATFTSQIRTITFEDVPSSYKPGIPFEGKIRVTGPNDQPIANEVVYLYVEDSTKITLSTDLKGLILFSLDTTYWKNSVSLRATTKDTNNEPFDSNVRRPDYGTAYQYVSPFFSKSNSFVMLKQINDDFSCNKDAKIHAEYIIRGNELNDGQTVLDFFYLVLSKGSIVRHDRVPVTVKAGALNKGELRITLNQVLDLAPYAQVVVYTLMPSGELVADSQDFPIQLCLKNQVSLKFSSLQVLPAEKTTLTLKASPKSLCSVRAIDQSVLLLKPEQELTVDYVYNQLTNQRLSGYSFEIDDSEPFPCFPGIRPMPEFVAPPAPEPTPVPTPEPLTGNNTVIRPKRSLIFQPSGQKDDIYSVFKNIGVKLVTNSDVRKPQECFFWKFDAFRDHQAPPQAPPPAPPPVPAENQSGNSKQTVREYFPETWIWDLVFVEDNGSVNVVKKAPDTITKWAAGAFCVSPVGFGVAPNTGITVFQPFFVSLTLPYSVIRGEVFTLRATVFNYLSNCIMVEVTLADSDQFTYRACEGCQYSVCVCSEETRTFSWIVTPKVLGDVSLKVSAEALKTRALCGNKVTTLPDVGRVDTVIQTLLVEAEGTPQMVGYNALLCPPKGPVEKSISLQLPEAFVPGSARASVSVLGDLMGRAMKNLDQLLAMPYGCGEQNMILFAPNIFILNYLKSSGQLTLPILDRAKVFLESGYQRELTYKHTDGSYSAFGMSDDSGNTWLTSFVMKSFGGASSYIFIDSVYINDARTWLSQLQKKDGCIRSVGNLIHTDLKGGVNDEVTLTAYVAAAMLELDGNSTDPVVESCLKCLTAAVNGQLDNLYTVALLSYTFSLAGDQEMRSKLITHLDQKAITDGGSRHWEYSSGSDSLNIELTSYVLLSLLTSPPLENFGLDYCSGIVRWLVQVQNPFGGFSSTQDTVVALEALAKYAAATYSPQSTTTVTVTSSGGLNKVFVVNQDNRLLYQEEQLSEVPGDYNITAKGQSCVLTQISLFYNIPPPKGFSAFVITTSTLAKCNAARPQLILYVTVRYRGSREETNMVLIDIKLLSGYVLDGSSLDQLKKDSSVKRVDADAGHISIYLDGLKKEQTQMYSVTLEDDQHVRNLKPAVVKVYDYYQTSDKGVTEYTSPCAASDNGN
ncbi:alpha-2-macroglobulin isoform X2 [Nothobranchius furzeri]|uniref:alpha-2-macroglobulin isoform X2 n=1 Tax=Nothobranchius furzeri TaxID=105023 RepID=UPI003904D675